MTLNEEQLLDNWQTFLQYIEKYITGERKQRLLDFYNKYEERFILLPASHKPQYHNCFPGGYIEHVNRVISASIDIYQIWIKYKVKETFTLEEVVFSALNHDLGKFGSFEYEAVLPNPSEWHVKNRGEIYTFNTQLDYMTVPDRGLWLLNKLGISVSKNEYLAIKLHDGLYDESNKSYLMSWAPETKLRTSLPHIIHQADFLAARVEFERENLDKFNTIPVAKPKSVAVIQNYNKPKQPSIDAIPSNTNLKDIMNTFFD
jgi:hypothetical protein